MNILFLCTGNSCRSQMAEGLFNHFQSTLGKAYSAGIQAQGVNPRAKQVLSEIGIDISSHTSNLLSDFDNISFDYVFTVCSNANQTCPVFPAKAKIIHVGFDDPPHLSSSLSDEKEILDIYRRVRDEIKVFIENIQHKM